MKYLTVYLYIFLVLVMFCITLPTLSNITWVDPVGVDSILIGCLIISTFLYVLWFAIWGCDGLKEEVSKPSQEKFDPHAR